MNYCSVEAGFRCTTRASSLADSDLSTRGYIRVVGEDLTIPDHVHRSFDTIENAFERSGSNGGNKGVDAAEVAIERVNLLSAIEAG